MTSAPRVAASPPGKPPATGFRLQLLMFNAQSSSPERARRQADWIAAQEGAGIVVITEVSSGPGGDALASVLTGHRYHSIVAPSSGTRDYRTILASRDATLGTVPSGISVLPHRAPAATVTAGGQQAGLLGLYVPSRGPRERRNEDKRAFQAAVTQALPGFLARFDHAFITSAHARLVRDCGYLHEPRRQGLTGHAAMTLTLGPEDEEERARR